MKLLFRPDDSGTDRGTGYATVDYSSSAEDETVVETTEDALSESGRAHSWWKESNTLCSI